MNFIINKHTDKYCNKSNEELIQLFPWLEANPETNNWVYGNTESNCWFDNFDSGWKDIGYSLCEEIQNVLENYDLVNEFQIHQIKQKYGELRLYYGFEFINKTIDEALLKTIYSEIDSIINKYERISKETCIVCGNKAKYITTGYILPYCENCYDSKWKAIKI